MRGIKETQDISDNEHPVLAHQGINRINNRSEGGSTYPEPPGGKAYKGCINIRCRCACPEKVFLFFLIVVLQWFGKRPTGGISIDEWRNTSWRRLDPPGFVPPPRLSRSIFCLSTKTSVWRVALPPQFLSSLWLSYLVLSGPLPVLVQQSAIDN